MRGWKVEPSPQRARSASMMRSLYAEACSAVVTGGTRLGMQIARPNWLAQAATVSPSTLPSRRW